MRTKCVQELTSIRHSIHSLHVDITLTGGFHVYVNKSPLSI